VKNKKPSRKFKIMRISKKKKIQNHFSYFKLDLIRRLFIRDL